MTEHDDQLISHFFESHRQEALPDDGFSDRVMARIEMQDCAQTAMRMRRWVAACVTVALVLFFALDGMDALCLEISRLLGNLWGAFVTLTLSPKALLNLLLGFFGLGLLICLLAFEDGKPTQSQIISKSR